MSIEAAGLCELNQSDCDKIGRAWARLVDCITHDLTTPLVTLRMTAESLGGMFSELVQGHKLAVENGLLKSNIADRQIDLIEQTMVSGLKDDLTGLLEFIRLLHPYTQMLLSSHEDNKPLSAKACIEKAIKDYPFLNANESAAVQNNCKDDFEFVCAPIFIEQLLNNLLKNALYYIKDKGKGEITLWTQANEDCNTIHIKDTAKGMDEFMLSQVFNRFFAKRGEDIQPGLGFCRLAFLQRGGDVLCKAVKGEYTEFIIKFPKL